MRRVPGRVPRFPHALRQSAAECGRVAIGNDFRLHYGHQPLTLRDGGIASQGVHGICDRQLCWHMLRRVQLQHIAPLGKAGALLIGLGAETLDVEGKNIKKQHILNFGTIANFPSKSCYDICDHL